MKYLLDTHIIIWALLDSNKLSEDIKKIILNKTNQIFYSSISPWEIEIKHQKDKRFKINGEDFCFLCDQNNVYNLPIQNKHVYEYKNVISKNHHDPFDKMLLAQAISEDMILITHDTKFKEYKDKHILMC